MWLASALTGGFNSGDLRMKAALLIVASLCVRAAVAQTGQISATQQTALVAFYTAAGAIAALRYDDTTLTVFFFFSFRAGCSTTACPRPAVGAVCSGPARCATNGDVVRIDVNRMGLNGTISTVVGSLTGLTYLYSHQPLQLLLTTYNSSVACMPMTSAALCQPRSVVFRISPACTCMTMQLLAQ